MATAIKKDKLRGIAEQLYINEGLTAKAISEQLGVTEATLSKWKKGRPGEKSWDERRAEVVSAPHKIKELLLAEMLKISEGKKSELNSDALVKIASSIEKIDKKVNTQMVISVFKEFDNFMADLDPVMAVKFLEFHKAFVHHKAATE